MWHCACCQIQNRVPQQAGTHTTILLQRAPRCMLLSRTSFKPPFLLAWNKCHLLWFRLGPPPPEQTIRFCSCSQCLRLWQDQRSSKSKKQLAGRRRQSKLRASPIKFGGHGQWGQNGATATMRKQGCQPPEPAENTQQVPAADLDACMCACGA